MNTNNLRQFVLELLPTDIQLVNSRLSSVNDFISNTVIETRKQPQTNALLPILIFYKLVLENYLVVSQELINGVKQTYISTENNETSDDNLVVEDIEKPVLVDEKPDTTNVKSNKILEHPVYTDTIDTSKFVSELNDSAGIMKELSEKIKTLQTALHGLTDNIKKPVVPENVDPHLIASTDTTPLANEQAIKNLDKIRELKEKFNIDELVKSREKLLSNFGKQVADAITENLNSTTPHA